jgi:hypothetical protein
MRGADTLSNKKLKTVHEVEPLPRSHAPAKEGASLVDNKEGESQAPRRNSGRVLRNCL